VKTNQTPTQAHSSGFRSPSAKVFSQVRRPAFTIDPRGEVPEPNRHIERAVRFGHRLRTFAGRSTAPAGGGEAVQRASDDEESGYEGDSDDGGHESSDEDYYEPQPRTAPKKQDPKSAIDKTSYKRTPTTLEYRTIGGATHSEKYDPKNLVRVSRTEGLKPSGPEFRNPTERGDVPFHVFNPHRLSPGQSSLNQSVVSHNAPSWAGMRAGGIYGNCSVTSGVFNSNVEKKEKKWRKDVQGSREPFAYETETKYEKIADNPRAEEIAALMTNPRWRDPKRVEKRLKKVAEKDPEATRIVSEKRKMSAKIQGKKIERMANLGVDIYQYMPRRAYDLAGHEKYKLARPGDSEGSDLELEEPKASKKRKRTLSNAGPKKKKTKKKAPED
jgi:hypothetical protein